MPLGHPPEIQPHALFGTPQGDFRWRQRCVNAAALPGFDDAGIACFGVGGGPIPASDFGNGAGLVVYEFIRPWTIGWLRFVMDHAAVAAKSGTMRVWAARPAAILGTAQPARGSGGVGIHEYHARHIFDATLTMSAAPIMLPTGSDMVAPAGQSAWVDTIALANIRTDRVPVVEGGGGVTPAEIKFDPDGAALLILAFNIGTAAGIRYGLAMR